MSSFDPEWDWKKNKEGVNIGESPENIGSSPQFTPPGYGGTDRSTSLRTHGLNQPVSAEIRDTSTRTTRILGLKRIRNPSLTDNDDDYFDVRLQLSPRAVAFFIFVVTILSELAENLIVSLIT